MYVGSLLISEDLSSVDWVKVESDNVADGSAQRKDYLSLRGYRICGQGGGGKATVVLS